MSRYREISCPLATATAPVDEALAAIGFNGFAIVDASDGARLTCWLPETMDPAPVCRVLRASGLDPGQGRWRDEEELCPPPSAPVAVSPGIWACPAVATEAPDTTLTRIRLPRAPAFGDGRHPTTRMAAELLEQLPLAGWRVLDCGCGTGLLGLAAHARGAVAVDFIDIDPGAVASCHEACALNGYPEARVRCGDLLAPADGVYDLVIANLYAELVEQLLVDPALDRLLPAGWLLISGLSAAKTPAVCGRLASDGWDIRDRRDEDWWHALLARRKA